MPIEAEPLIGGVKRILSGPPYPITNQHHVISRISFFYWKTHYSFDVSQLLVNYILVKMKTIRNIGIDAMIDTIKRINITPRLWSWKHHTNLICEICTWNWKNVKRLCICSEWKRFLLVTSFFCDREQRNKIGDDSVSSMQEFLRALCLVQYIILST